MSNRSVQSVQLDRRRYTTGKIVIFGITKYQHLNQWKTSKWVEEIISPQDEKRVQTHKKKMTIPKQFKHVGNYMLEIFIAVIKIVGCAIEMVNNLTKQNMFWMMVLFLATKVVISHSSKVEFEVRLTNENANLTYSHF